MAEEHDGREAKTKAGGESGLGSDDQGADLRLLRAVSPAEGISQIAGEIPLIWRSGGAGKNQALLWEAIRQANEYPRVDTLLLRRTFPELEKSLLSYFRRDVPRDMYASYNDSKHVVTWRNGSTTRFGLFLGNGSASGGLGNGRIYELSDAQLSDDGAAVAGSTRLILFPRSIRNNGWTCSPTASSSHI